MHGSAFGNSDQAPLVTVAMSVYDGDRPEWLIRAFDSVLQQTYAPLEFIVVSDGINNAVLSEIIGRYATTDGRVKQVQLDRKGGLAHALNCAISASSGALIVRMDADDISPPERINRMVSFMLCNPDVDVAGSYILEFSDEQDLGSGKVIRYPCAHGEMKSCFLRRNPLAHPSAIFRRSFFERAGSYPLFSLTNEDTLLWLNGFKAGCRFANLPEVLYFFRNDLVNAARRVGFRKSFSDFIDRLRVIIDFGGGAGDYLAAFGRFLLQNAPRPVYLWVRSLLLYR